ncbi:hypothetical protein [Methanobacterium alcaliphilum]|uniref:hypothetical protein n=1 Tax=Methanobacterium alcaliphilum TaxID=392018 RepID=UPI00200AD4FD|nr:hypothetical protein [Methanobacterium alcaliphilum]MCK9151981.1 hypothetical protein [Methanobacterium alcaliphilum]
MEILTQLLQLEEKEVIFKWGDDGRALKGKISKIHKKYMAFTVEYYDPEAEAGAGILAKFDDVDHINDHEIIFKK